MGPNFNMWGGEFPHPNKQFSDASWVSYNSVLTLWYRDSIRVHELRTQSLKTAPHHPYRGLQTPVTSPATAYKSEIPIAPSLGSVRLPDWLTKLRNILLTRSPVYYKRI